MNIQFSPPDISDLEIAEITSALKSGWITTGPKTKLFENKIAEYCGVNKAVCLNSATSCLELILRRLGIGASDEVITCAYTYTASASVIHHVGAKIVLVDVEPNTYHIDYEGIANAITERTKAVIPVDIGGVMVDYDKVFAAVESKRELFKPSDNNIQKALGRVAVVSDAAHSFGAEYRGKKAGAVADFTAFSFHAVKNLTTAEGGALTWKPVDGISDDDIYHWFMLYSLHGQSKDALSKMKLGSWEYDIVYPAYKCNMTDLTAAMGLVQLRRFDGLSERRKHIIREYDKALLQLGIERLNHFESGSEGNGHLYLMRVPGMSESRRNAVIQKMAEAGIACNVHFKPLPMHTAYKNLGFSIQNYPWSYRQYVNEITLPLHTLLTDDEVAYVADTMKAILTGATVEERISESDVEALRVYDVDAESISAVYSIIKECGERMFLENNLLHWADPLPASVIRTMCLEENVFVIRSKSNKKVLAAYSVSEKPSPYFAVDKNAVYVSRMAVSPELWRRGIGRIMLNHAVNFCKQRGYDTIRTVVYDKSADANGFFRAMGFSKLYQRPTKNFIVNCIEKRLNI